MFGNHNTCKECGRAIHGRNDKRFCDDAYRNNFNRHKNQVEKIMVPEQAMINASPAYKAEPGPWNPKEFAEQLFKIGYRQQSLRLFRNLLMVLNHRAYQITQDHGDHDQNPGNI